MSPSSISDVLDLDPALRRAVQAKANHGRDWARTNRDQIERAVCKDLAGFVRLAWPVLEPGTPYVHGRVIDAICQHLEAVTAGEIKRLLITVPPGTAKSLLTSVFWPAWTWGPRGLPHKRFLGFSYSDRLSVRDSRRTKLLIESDWYQHLWPMPLAVDENAKSRFENSARGWRMASSVGGVGTGERADVVCLDDIHAVADADSALKLESTLLWFRETLPTRMNNPSVSAIVVIMQRINQRDVAGEIISRELGYEHLCLPMRYEPERHCTTLEGRFTDWRTRPGQLLFPARYPLDAVEKLEHVMGSYATAGQFQQSPSPRGGGLIPVDCLRVVKDWPRHARVVRSWDLAATEEGTADDPDYTAGVKVAYLDGRAWIVDVSRGRLAPLAVEQRLKATAILDGHGCAIVIEREGGSSGKMTAAHLVTSVLAGYEAREQLPTGSKVARSRTFAAAVEAGNVDLVEGPWNAAFIGELREFPRGSHDDQVDAAAAGFNFLSSEPEFFVL